MRERILIGIDIGGTNIELCAFSITARSEKEAQLLHRSYPCGADCNGLCSYLFKCVNELLDNMRLTFLDIQAIGIAMPGEIDVRNGIVRHAYNLDLHDAPIISIMQGLMPGVKLGLANDADAATLGEYKFGALKGSESGCLITLGTGVGAGLIINGRLYQGGNGRGTEFGHVTIDMNGSICSCGNIGCVETLCSATYLQSIGSQAFVSNTNASCCKKITAKQIVEFAKQGDETAIEIFDRYVENLSFAISSYITLLDPQIIALGGGVSLAGEFLLKPLAEKTQKKAFFNPIGDIVLAKLGDKAGAIGAAFLCDDNLSVYNQNN